MKLSTEGRVSVCETRPSKQQHRSLCHTDTTVCLAQDKTYPYGLTQSATRSGRPKETKSRDVHANIHSFLVPSIGAAVLETATACGSSAACLASDTCQGTNDLPSHVKPNVSGNTSSADTISGVMTVPETLGMDLTVTKRGEEDGYDVELFHPALPCSVSVIDNKHNKVQGQIQLAVTPDPDSDSLHSDSHGDFNTIDIRTAKHSTKTSQQQIHQESKERMDQKQEKKMSGCRRIQLSDSAQDSQAAWQTDSIVFGNTKPKSADHLVQGGGGTSSLCIVDEGVAGCDPHSPIFTKHCCDLVSNDQSLALFDEEDCELDPGHKHVHCLATPVSESDRALTLAATTSSSSPHAVSSSSPSLLKTELQLPLHMSSQICKGTHSRQQSQGLLVPTDPITNPQPASFAISGPSSTLMETGFTDHLGSSEVPGITSNAEVTESDPAGLSLTDTPEYVVSEGTEKPYIHISILENSTLQVF